ncbi:MAG TPA: hypothetical protein VE715_03735 [Blastocatellia bacterium]|nr:hypothetical protein [Blastocatellia bacterium]
MDLGNVHPKISREFSRRLDRLQPRDKVRAIVMLRAEGNGSGGAGRPSRAERQDVAEQLSQAAEAALPEIDQILERYDGRRMAERPSAVGAISVETTAGGVIALARADCVKTILEDQNILPLS